MESNSFSPSPHNFPMQGCGTQFLEKSKEGRKTERERAKEREKEECIQRKWSAVTHGHWAKMLEGGGMVGGGGCERRGLSLSRTLRIPGYLLKRRNIINPHGINVHFFVFQEQDRQTIMAFL